tara:strand:+ start:732 stop:950 length:219 start_codon:yes stop_codon:yes gene_type:complete
MGRQGITPFRFDKSVIPRIGKEFVEQLIVQCVPTPMEDEMTDKLLTRQRNITNGIKHLVANKLVCEAESLRV